MVFYNFSYLLHNQVCSLPKKRQIMHELRELRVRIKILFFDGFAKLQYQAVGDQFPEVLYSKIFHAIFFFDAVQLPVATMAGDNYHFGACDPDLFHLISAVSYPFVIISGRERTASASAAQLVLFCRIKIDPVFNTLVKYPSWFVKKSVTE